MSEPQSPNRRDAPPVVDSDNPGVRRKERGDLWYFETSSVPRHEEICQRFARVIAPWWGFAVYGVLYVFVAMFALLAGMMIAIGLKELLGVPDGSTLAGVLAWAIGGATFMLSWWPFARWVKRRRASARPLIRDGELLEGIVLDKFAGGALEVAGRVATELVASRVGRVKFYRVGIAHGTGDYVLRIPVTGWTVPRANTPIAVLFNPTSKYALVFDESFKARVATVGSR